MSHAAGAAAPPAAAPQVAQAATAVSASAAGAPAAGPSTNVTVNLIRLLVQQGVLSKDKADALIREAESEAAQAAAHSGAGASPAKPGEVRVPYVPEIVRRQIRDEIKQDVLTQSKNERWGDRGAFPEWISRFRFFGDLRLREETQTFDKTNVRRRDFLYVDTNAINASSGILLQSNGVAQNPTIPVINTDKNVERVRVRARFGFEATVNDDFTGIVRLGTGNNSSPTSTNQTLGADGINNGGFFQKDYIWLDQAYITYHPTYAPWFNFWGGRMKNPFLYTDLVWDDDVNLDGAAIRARQSLFDDADGLTAGLTLGAFPVQEINLSTNDKWLYAAQGRFDWKPDPDQLFSLAGAYYYFKNVTGRQLPYDQFAPNSTLPAFVQGGNTLTAINVAPLPGNGNITDKLGLAAFFRELNITAQADFANIAPIEGMAPVHIVLTGDWVQNLGFNENGVIRNSVFTTPASPAQGTTAAVPASSDRAGGTGFLFRFLIGQPQLTELWDWNFNVAYKYLESDAVIDAFTDSDFHNGGTDAKGYIINGNLAVAHNTWVALQYISADAIQRPPFSVDTFYADLNLKF